MKYSDAKELLIKFIELSNDSLSDYWQQLIDIRFSATNYENPDWISSIEKEIISQAENIRDNAAIKYYSEMVENKWIEVEWN